MANKSKVVVTEEVEVEVEDLNALTVELKDLKQRFNMLVEEKNEVVDELWERENEITLLSVELMKASSKATCWKESSDDATK